MLLLLAMGPVISTQAATSCAYDLYPTSTSPSGPVAAPVVRVEAVFQTDGRPLCMPIMASNLHIDGNPVPYTIVASDGDTRFTISWEGDALQNGQHRAFAYIFGTCPPTPPPCGTPGGNQINWQWTQIAGAHVTDGFATPDETSVARTCAVLACVGPYDQPIPVQVQIGATDIVFYPSLVGVGPVDTQIPGPFGPIPITLCPDGCPLATTHMSIKTSLHVVAPDGTPHGITVDEEIVLP